MHVKDYEILKILNNNVVLALERDTGQEMILLGKGIGFQKKEGITVGIQSSKIDKTYVVYNKETKSEYLQMLTNIDPRVIEISEIIISIATKEFGPLNPYVHILLTDHISFTLERIKMGVDIQNPFLSEIKVLYDEEFSIGLKAINLIEETFGIRISDSEAGFIALHLQSARENKQVKETTRTTRLIKELTDMIQNDFSIHLSNDDFTYIRLINHLKAVLKRLEENKYIQNQLLEDIKDKFKESFLIAKKLATHIERTTSFPVPENEVGYITLHIERLRK